MDETTQTVIDDLMKRTIPPLLLPGKVMHFRYHHRNIDRTSERSVMVEKVWHGTSPRYPDPSILFLGRDLKSGKTREFAYGHVQEWLDDPAPKEEGRFWIVWNPAHPTTPTIKHRKKVSAEFAAKKLARQNPDQADSIYVMQVTSAWSMKGEKTKARHF